MLTVETVLKIVGAEPMTVAHVTSEIRIRNLVPVECRVMAAADPALFESDVETALLLAYFASDLERDDNLLTGEDGVSRYYDKAAAQARDAGSEPDLRAIEDAACDLY